MLALTPLNDDLSLDAKSDFEMVEFVVSEIFKKPISNVVAFILDNISTNQSLATLLGCGFVGCASQRFFVGLQIDILSSSFIHG